MADNADNNGATSSRPLLFSVPAEVFNNIITQASKPSLKSLSQTCRSLHSSEILIPGLWHEPLSREDFPMTKKQLNAIGFRKLKFENGKRGPRVYGFAAEMHDDKGLCDDDMSLKGLGEIRDQDYMTIDDFHEILQKLDKQTGSYVKSLIVPDFLTIDDIRPFAIHCSNIEDLDLESFMHRIDYVEEVDAWYLDEGPQYGLDVHQLVEECSGLFQNLRFVKIAYNGCIRKETEGYEKSRATFEKMLRQAPKLECLEIHNRSEQGIEWHGFRDPQHAANLIHSLDSHASPRLTELRLYDMMPIVRSLPMLLSTLSERLPKLKNIAISINEDLHRIAQEYREYYDLKPENFTEFEKALYEATPHTCWEYLRMLQILCEDPNYKVTSLDGKGYCELNPSYLYFVKDTLDWMGSRVEVFKSLKEHMSWSPTFHWHDQMRQASTREGYVLTELSEPDRKEQLKLIREVFETVKEADIPVKLLLDTRARDCTFVDQLPAGNVGSFFVRVVKPLQLHPSHPRFARAEQGFKERYGPQQWYLKAVGDLVDELTVEWGHKCLRQPLDGQGMTSGQIYQYHRPRHEIVREEKSMIQSLWTDLADTFPHLKRLEVHVPDEVYIGDEEMAKLLPGESWNMECGKDVVVKDFRKTKKVDNLGPVTFLTRIWTKVANVEKDISSDVEMMQL